MQLEQVSECEVCGAREYRVLFRKADHTYVQCRRCGFVYINPRCSFASLKSVYDAEAREYYVTRSKTDLDFSSDFSNRLRGLRCYRKTGCLLDVGCSTGAFLEAARKQHWDVRGCELAAPAAEFAVKQKALPVFNGLLTDAGYPSDHFDVVTCWATLEHVSEPFRTLTEIHRILRPGGLLVLTVPNWGSLPVRLLGRRYRYITFGHLHYFSAATLRRILTRAGFLRTEISSEYFNPQVILEDLRRLPGDPLKTDWQERTTAGAVKTKWYYPLARPLYRALMRTIELSLLGVDLRACAVK